MTPPQDYDRLVENLYRNYGKVIKDQETFNKAYNEYLSGLSPDHPLRQSGAKKTISALYRQKYPFRITEKEYRAGIRQREKRIRREGEFIFTGLISDKVVVARADAYRYKEKTRTVYRDRKGRFVSLRRKS